MTTNCRKLIFSNLILGLS